MPQEMIVDVALSASPWLAQTFMLEETNTKKDIHAANLIKSGVDFASSGQLKKALAKFDQALVINPANAVGHYNRGRSYYEAKDYKRAIIEFSEAIRLLELSEALQIAPIFAQAYNNRGSVYYDIGELARALADYDRAIQIDPTYAQAYNNRGNVYYNNEEFARALLDYNRAIRIDPTCADAYNNRGNVYYQRAWAKLGLDDEKPRHAELDRALSDYSEAVRLKPQDAILLKNRGSAYFQKGQYSSALADQNRAIWLDPNDATAWYNRATTWMLIGESLHAFVDFAKAVQLNKDITKSFYISPSSLYEALQVIKSLDETLGDVGPLKDETNIRAAFVAFVRKACSTWPYERQLLLHANWAVALELTNIGYLINKVSYVGDAKSNNKNKTADIFATKAGGPTSKSLKERKAFLDDHYGGRTKWAEWIKALNIDPTPSDFKKWADKNFPDRRELGLVFSDLKYLDHQAYKKIINWKMHGDEFGFPSKRVRHDPSVVTPTGAEVFEAYRRGSPDATELARTHARARYHTLRRS